MVEFVAKWMNLCLSTVVNWLILERGLIGFIITSKKSTMEVVYRDLYCHIAKRHEKLSISQSKVKNVRS